MKKLKLENLTITSFVTSFELKSVNDMAVIGGAGGRGTGAGDVGTNGPNATGNVHAQGCVTHVVNTFCGVIDRTFDC